MEYFKNNYRLIYNDELASRINKNMILTKYFNYLSNNSLEKESFKKEFNIKTDQVLVYDILWNDDILSDLVTIIVLENETDPIKIRKMLKEEIGISFRNFKTYIME